jgi:hypothetical protein
MGRRSYGRRKRNTKTKRITKPIGEGSAEGFGRCQDIFSSIPSFVTGDCPRLLAD